MAQCQTFFDDKSPSICKSSSSNELLPSPASTTTDGNGDVDMHPHLELRLGPSADVNIPNQLHEMVRPIPLYPSLDKQRSGIYDNAVCSSPLFRGRSDSSLAEKALFSKDSAFSTPLFTPREQVWQSLHNTDAILGCDSRTSKAPCDDGASSLLGRRSVSMQLLMSADDISEVGDSAPIRRSCSIGRPPARQSSFGQEALVDESPDLANSLVHLHQKDELDLRKKKETQALRRLEARKRRRLLLDKQQRKTRQNNGPNNSQLISPVEKASLVRMCSLDAKYPKGLDEVMAAKLVDGGDSKNLSQVKDADYGLAWPPLYRSSDGKRDSCKRMHKECESTSSSRERMQGDLSRVQQMIASCDLSPFSGHKEDSLLGQTGQTAKMGDAVKVSRSSCSETESLETKEKEMDFSERESSSQKSSTENYLDYGVSASASPPRPVFHPQTFPGTSLVGLKVQVSSSLHQSPHYPRAKFSGDEESHACQPSHGKISKLLSEVPSNITIRRSVGVFSEGKWRTPDEDSSSPPLRRTASTISQMVVPDLQSRPKKLETYTSLCASQLKFAAMGSNNAIGVSSRRSDELQCGVSSRLHPREKVLKEEHDSLTLAPHMATTPVKVKQEEDVMDDMEVEPIRRQTSGSFSELPSVTTTGRGPNGRTINGVMYITECRSVRLVCRCHGKHMSPTEFVEHAGSTDLSNPLKNIVVNAFPMLNQLTNAPV